MFGAPRPHALIISGDVKRERRGGRGLQRGTLDGLSPVCKGSFYGLTGCLVESFQMRQNEPENGLCSFAVIYMMALQDHVRVNEKQA